MYVSASDPCMNWAAVTPNDTTEIPISRTIYCGAAGTLSYVPADSKGDATVTIPVAAFSYHPIRARRIRATGTTGLAGNIWIGW